MEFIIGKKRPKDIKNSLDHLPLGLKGTYDNILQQINGQDPDNRLLAYNVLSWISHAPRPLNPKEFCIAMSIAEGDTELDDDDLLDQLDLVHVCGGLVTIDELSQTVRFVHYTVQEYLETNAEVSRGVAIHATMAKTCIAYLSFGAFANQPPVALKGLRKRFFNRRLARNAFYRYAALNWGYHTKLSDEEESVLDMICSFSTLHRQMESAIHVFFNEWKCWDSYDSRPGHNIFPAAAAIGLPRLTKALINFGGDKVDFKDWSKQSTLSHAAENGHLAVVELLVGRVDVQPDSRECLGQSPLSRAAENGHLAVVELLVPRDDVQADSRDNNSQSPLTRAAENGHLAVVEMLVGRGDVQADSRDKCGRSPLSRAAKNGHLAVVELLVSRNDVQSNSSDRMGLTPLSHASLNGHIAVVQLLVAREDVQADSRDCCNQSPLSHAANNGHLAVVQLLVGRNDVQADSMDNYGQSPLFRAADMGHLAVVELLVGREDIQADSRDKRGRSPLSRAAKNGHVAVVKLLVARDDVDVDSRNNNGSLPVFMAAKRRHTEVVEILINASRGQVCPISHTMFTAPPLFLEILNVDW